MFKKENREGFTLVELIVVIAILAILALILIPAITGYIDKSNKSSLEASARALYSQVALDASSGELIEGDGYSQGKFNADLTGKSESYKVLVKYSDDKTGKEVKDADKILRVQFDENGNLVNNWDDKELSK